MNPFQFRLYILRPDGIILPAASVHEFAVWIEDINNRRIKHDDIDGVNVSTIFLGIDHNWRGKGPPVLFETMMFTDDECIMIGRTCSKADAIDLHDGAVKQARELRASAADALSVLRAISGQAFGDATGQDDT